MLIGLYRAKDPFTVIPQERIHALAAEAMYQGVTLVVFNSDGVNFEERTITGKIRQKGEWEECTVPFPEVLITDNPTIPKNRKAVEERLRKELPITTYLLHSKEYIANQILSKTDLAQYLIPSRSLKEIEDVFSYLENEQDIFIKPVSGFRGIGIYNVQKLNNNQYVIKNNQEQRVVNDAELEAFIKPLLEKRYIMQPTIKARTKDGLVYDFRIHIQRGNEGSWGITKIYPRIGLSGSVLSNVSQGGMTSTVDYFLFTQFGEQQAKMYEEKLKKVALDIAVAVDKHYKFPIDELGVDLTIDDKGNIKFFEANSGPQSKYHEWERAKNTITYAKYLGNKYKQQEIVFKSE